MPFSIDVLGEHFELFYLGPTGWIEATCCDVIPLDVILRVRILKRAFKIGQFVNIKSGKITLQPVDGSIGSVTTSVQIDDFGNHTAHFYIDANFTLTKIYQLKLDGFEGLDIETFPLPFASSVVSGILTNCRIHFGNPQVPDANGSLIVISAATEHSNQFVYIPPTSSQIANPNSGIVSVITRCDDTVSPVIQETSVKEINPLNHPVPRRFQDAGFTNYDGHVYHFDGSIINFVHDSDFLVNTIIPNSPIAAEFATGTTVGFCDDAENDFSIALTVVPGGTYVLEFVHEADHSLLLSDATLLVNILTGKIRTEAERGRYRLRTTYDNNEVAYSTKIVTLENNSGVIRPTSSDIFVGSMVSSDTPVVSGSELFITAAPQFNGGYTSSAPIRKTMLGGMLVFKPSSMETQTGVRFPFVLNTSTGEYEALVEMGDQLYDQHLCSADIMVFIRDEDVCGNKFWKLIHNASIHYEDITPPQFVGEAKIYLLDSTQIDEEQGYLCTCRDQKVAIAANCIEDCTGLVDVQISVQYKLDGECLESEPISMIYVPGFGQDCEDVLIGDRYFASLDLCFLAYTTSCNEDPCQYTFVVYLYSQSGEVVSSTIHTGYVVESCVPPKLTLLTKVVEMRHDKKAVNISTLSVEGFSALHFQKKTCVDPEIRLKFLSVVDETEGVEECKTCITKNEDLQVFCRIEGINVIYDNPIQPFWKVMKLYKVGLNQADWYWYANFNIINFYQPNNDEIEGQEQPRYGCRFRFIDCACNNIASDVITKLVNQPYFYDMNQNEGGDQNSLGGFWVGVDETCPVLKECCFDAYWLCVDGESTKPVVTCEIPKTNFNCDLQRDECKQSHQCSAFGIHIPSDVFQDEETCISTLKFQICLQEGESEYCLSQNPENIHCAVDPTMPIPCESVCEYLSRLNRLKYGGPLSPPPPGPIVSAMNYIYISGAGQTYYESICGGKCCLAGLNLYSVIAGTDAYSSIIIENVDCNGLNIVGGDMTDQDVLHRIFIRNYKGVGLSINEGADLSHINGSIHHLFISPEVDQTSISVKQSRDVAKYHIGVTNILTNGSYSTEQVNILKTDGSTLTVSDSPSLPVVGIPDDPFRCILSAYQGPNIVVKCGIITQDTTWSGIVQVNGEVIFMSLGENPITLTIEPGTEVRFKHVDAKCTRRPAALIISQTAIIVANGTSDKPICFVPTPVAGVYPQGGSWGGVVIIGNSTAYRGQPNGANVLINDIVPCFESWYYPGYSWCFDGSHGKPLMLQDGSSLLLDPAKSYSIRVYSAAQNGHGCWTNGINTFNSEAFQEIEYCGEYTSTQLSQNAMLTNDSEPPSFFGENSIYQPYCILINDLAYNCDTSYTLDICKPIKIDIAGIVKDCDQSTHLIIDEISCVTFKAFLVFGEVNIPGQVKYMSESDVLQIMFESNGFLDGNCLQTNVSYRLHIQLTDCAGNVSEKRLIEIYCRESEHVSICFLANFGDVRSRFCICADTDCLPIIKDCNPILDILIESGFNDYNAVGKLYNVQSAKLDTPQKCLQVGSSIVFRVCSKEVFEDCLEGGDNVHCIPSQMCARMIAQDPIGGCLDVSNSQVADKIVLDPLNPGCVLISFTLVSDLANYDNYIFQMSFDCEQPIWTTVIRCICIEKSLVPPCNEDAFSFQVTHMFREGVADFDGTSYQLCLNCQAPFPSTICIGIPSSLLCTNEYSPYPNIVLHKICDHPESFVTQIPPILVGGLWVFCFYTLSIGTFEIEIEIPYLSTQLRFDSECVPREEIIMSCYPCRFHCKRLVITDVKSTQVMECLENVCCTATFKDAFCNMFPLATIELPKLDVGCKYGLLPPTFLDAQDRPIPLMSKNAALITDVVSISDSTHCSEGSDNGPNWAYLVHCNNQIRFRLFVDEVPSNNSCCRYNLLLFPWEKLIEEFNPLTNCWVSGCPCIDFVGDYRLYLVCHREQDDCLECLTPICLPTCSEMPMEFIRIAPQQRLEMFNVPSKIDCETHKFVSCPIDWINFELDTNCMSTVSQCGKNVEKRITSGYIPLKEPGCKDLCINEQNVLFVMEGLHCKDSVVAYFKVKGAKCPFQLTLVEWDGDDCEDIFKFDEGEMCNPNSLCNGHLCEDVAIPLVLIKDPFPTQRNKCCTIEVLLTNACCETVRYNVLVLFVGQLTSVLKICDPCRSICLLNQSENATGQNWLGIRDKPVELLFQVNGELLNAMLDIQDPCYNEFVPRPETPVFSLQRHASVCYSVCNDRHQIEEKCDDLILNYCQETKSIVDGIAVEVQCNPADCPEFPNNVVRNGGTPNDFADVCGEGLENILNGGFEFAGQGSRKLTETLKIKFDPTLAQLCTEQGFCLNSLVYKYKFGCRVISFDVLKFLQKIHELQVFKAALQNAPCEPIPTDVDICDVDIEPNSHNWPIYHYKGSNESCSENSEFECGLFQSPQPLLCESCDTNCILRIVMYKSLEIQAVSNFDWREVAEPGFVNPDTKKRIFGRSEAQNYLGRVWRVTGGFSSKFFCLDLVELNPMVGICTQKNLFKRDTGGYISTQPYEYPDNAIMVEAYKTLIAHCEYIDCDRQNVPDIDLSDFVYKQLSDSRVYCDKETGQIGTFPFYASDQTSRSILPVAADSTLTVANYWAFDNGTKQFTYTRTTRSPVNKFNFYTHSFDGSRGVVNLNNLPIGNVISLAASFSLVNIADNSPNPFVSLFFVVYTKPKSDGTNRASWYNSRIVLGQTSMVARLTSGIVIPIDVGHIIPEGGGGGSKFSTSFSPSDIIFMVNISSNSTEPRIGWRFQLNSLTVFHKGSQGRVGPIGLARRLCDRVCNKDILLVTIPTSPLGSLQAIFRDHDINRNMFGQKDPVSYDWDSETNIDYAPAIDPSVPSAEFSFSLVARNYVTCDETCDVVVNHIFEMRNTLYANHILENDPCYPEPVSEDKCPTGGFGCMLNFYGMDFKPNWGDAMFPHNIDCEWHCDKNHEQIWGYGCFIGYGTSVDPCMPICMPICDDEQIKFTLPEECNSFPILKLHSCESMTDFATCKGTLQCNETNYIDWDYCSAFIQNPIYDLCHLEDDCIPSPEQYIDGEKCNQQNRSVIMIVNGYRTHADYNCYTPNASLCFDFIEAPSFDGRHVRQQDDYRVSIKGSSVHLCTPTLDSICSTNEEYGSLNDVGIVGSRENPIVGTSQSGEICLFQLCGCNSSEFESITSLNDMSACGLHKLRLVNPCDFNSIVQTVQFKNIDPLTGRLCFERLDTALNNIIHCLKLCLPDICYYDFADFEIPNRRIDQYQPEFCTGPIDQAFNMTTNIIASTIVMNMYSCINEAQCCIFSRFICLATKCARMRVVDQFGQAYYLSVEHVSADSTHTLTSTQVLIQVNFNLDVDCEIPYELHPTTYLVVNACNESLVALLTAILPGTGSTAQFWTSPVGDVEYAHIMEFCTQLPIYNCFCCLPLCLCYQEGQEQESCFVFNELKVDPEQDGSILTDKRIFVNTLHTPFKSRFVSIGMVFIFAGLNLEMQIPVVDFVFGQIQFSGMYKDQIEVEFSSGDRTTYNITTAIDLGSAINLGLTAVSTVGSGSLTGFRLLKDIRNLVPGQRLPSESASRFFSNTIQDTSLFELSCLTDGVESIRDNDVFFSGKLNVESFLPWEGGLMNNELYNQFDGSQQLSIHRALKVHLKDVNSSQSECGNMNQAAYGDNETFGSTRKNPAPVGFMDLYFKFDSSQVTFNAGSIYVELTSCNGPNHYGITFVSKQDPLTTETLCVEFVDGCLKIVLPPIEMQCSAKAPTEISICIGSTLLFGVFAALVSDWEHKDYPDRLICKLKAADCNELTFERNFTMEEFETFIDNVQSGIFAITKENTILRDNVNSISGRECMDIAITLNEEFFADNESSEFSVNQTMDRTQDHAQDQLKLVPSGSKSFYFLFRNRYDCVQSIVATRDALTISNNLVNFFKQPNRLDGDKTFVRGQSIIKAPRMFLTLITSENDCTVTLVPDCRGTFANSACFRLKANRPEGGGFPVVTEAKITVLLKYIEDGNTSLYCQDDDAAFKLRSQKTQQKKRATSPRREVQGESVTIQEPFITSTKIITLANGKQKTITEKNANPLYKSILVHSTTELESNLESKSGSNVVIKWDVIGCPAIVPAFLPFGDAPLVNIVIQLGKYTFVPTVDGSNFYLQMTVPKTLSIPENQFLREFISMAPDDIFFMRDTHGNQNQAVLISKTTAKPSHVEPRVNLLILMKRTCIPVVANTWFLFGVAEGTWSRVQQTYFWVTDASPASLSLHTHIDKLAIERKGSTSLCTCDVITDTISPVDKQHVYAQVDFDALVQQSSFEKIAHGILCNIPMIRPQSVDNYMQVPKGNCPSGVVTCKDLMQIKLQIEIGGVTVHTNCDEYVYVASGNNNVEDALCIAKRLIDGRHLSIPATCHFTDTWCLRDCSGTITATACDTEIIGLSNGVDRCLRVNIIKEIEQDDLADYLCKLNACTTLSDFDVDDIARIRSLLLTLIMMLTEAGLTLNDAGISEIKPALLANQFIKLLKYMKTKFGLEALCV